MDKITYRITLDAHKSGVQKTLYGFFAGDVLSRRIAISLVGGSTPCRYDEVTAAMMYVTKPNGVTSYNACTVEDNTIFYDVLQTDIDSAGIVTMQFKVMSGETVLYAPEFALEVQESKHSDTPAEATPTFTALEEALLKAETVASNEQERVEAEVKRAEEYEAMMGELQEVLEEADDLVTTGGISENKAKKLIEESVSDKVSGEEYNKHIEDKDIHISEEERIKWNNNSGGGASQETIDNIISGTTPAGNSNLLQGYTAEKVGESGARNLIPYPYVNSTRTVEGIDWTDNGDGTLTANGTAGNTSHSIFNVRVRSGSNDPNPLILKADTYTYTGTPKGGSTSTYCTQIGHTVDGAFKAIGYDTGDGFTFTLTEDVQIQIQPLVAKNQPVNNLTFRPMLELGSVAHDYVPYHLGGAVSLNGYTEDDFQKVVTIPLNSTVTLAELEDMLPTDGKGRFVYRNGAPSDFPTNLFVPPSNSLLSVEVNKVGGVAYYNINAVYLNGTPVKITGYYNGVFFWKLDNDAGNADAVRGFPLAIDGKRGLATINTDYGVMEVGQIIDFHTEDGQDFKVRLVATDDGKFEVWKDGSSYMGIIATTADLANFLPLTGGYMNGPLTFVHGSAGNGNEGGEFYLQKPTISKFDNNITIDVWTEDIRIFASHDGKTKGFMLDFDSLDGLSSVLHTGNIGQHALTRYGAEAVDQVNVLSPNHTNDTAITRVLCANQGVSYLTNALPSYSVVRQISLEPKNITDNPNDALKYQYTEDGSTWYNVAIHHDLNSAKVLVSNTAPSDTAAVWVDTANNKVKAYKDGAWTALA